MAVPDKIKRYLAELGGGTVTEAGCDMLAMACMMDQPLPGSPPTGYGRADFCNAEVYDWCALNYGYTPPGAPPVTPPTGDTGIFMLCSLPGGATIKVDGVTVPWKAPLCPTWRDYVVSANVDHTIVYSLGDYKDDTQTELVTPGAYLQVPARLEPVIGGHAGYVRIVAHDAITGDALKARVSIDGYPLAKRFLTPHTRNLGIAATKNEKDYGIAVTYPGYNKAEKTVTVKTTHTVTNPLLVDFRMTETKIWKEVEVVKEAKKVAWVTSITMDSPLIWDVSHRLKIKFLFYLDAKYQGFFDFYKIPPGWDYKLESLKSYAPKVHTITSPRTDKLGAWAEDNDYTITWDWTCQRSIPEGVYVVVARLMYEE